MSEAQGPYPYVFRVRDHKWVTGAAAVTTIVVAVLVAVLGVRAMRSGTMPVFFVAAPVMMAVALYSWTVALARAVVWPDRIEVSNGFRTRTLKANEIRGYRRRKDLWIALVPQQGAPALVPSSTWSVRTLVPWFTVLPDLTLENRRNIEREIASDPRYGATHLERQLRISEAKRWVRRLNWLGGVVGVGSFFWPFEPRLALAAAGAATALSLAFVASSRGLVRIDMADDQDPRPSLWIGALPPGLFVYAKAAEAHSEASLLSASLAATAYVTLLAVSDEQLRSKPATALLTTAGVAAYFWAVSTHWVL